MKKIIVLGCGMVGSAIAADLKKKHDVTAADKDSEKLNKLSKKYSLKTIRTDLASADEITELVKDYDLVIGAVPGFMGYCTTKAVINAGVDIIDISFFGQDALELNELALEKDVTAVVDCGVAPGMSNMILGYHNENMEITDYKCYVGGLPFKRTWPYQYKAPFSPIDVIEEYTRPVHLIENGHDVTKEALSDREYVEFDKIGTLEAFNTDGLRTLAKTIKAENMAEKTLRYPGHIEHIKTLRKTGFFGNDPLDVNGVMIRPIDVTTRLLFPLWQFDEEEPDFTVMKIIIRGSSDGKTREFTYDLFDEYNKETGISSMARTTGYTCSAAAELVINGDYTHKGISPPEYVGADEKCFKKVLAYLEERSVIYNVREETID